MVRIITTDEREENIYVLNYLLCGLQLNYFNGNLTMSGKAENTKFR